MAFSLQCAHCESITAIKCQFQSHGSFATVSTLKEFLQRIFSIFAPYIMSSPSSLKRNMIKNKSKKLQVLSALPEGRSKEQLQQESSETREKNWRSKVQSDVERWVR